MRVTSPLPARAERVGCSFRTRDRRPLMETLGSEVPLERKHASADAPHDDRAHTEWTRRPTSEPEHRAPGTYTKCLAGTLRSAAQNATAQARVGKHAETLGAQPRPQETFPSVPVRLRKSGFALAATRSSSPVGMARVDEFDLLPVRANRVSGLPGGPCAPGTRALHGRLRVTPPHYNVVADLVAALA